MKTANKIVYIVLVIILLIIIFYVKYNKNNIITYVPLYEKISISCKQIKGECIVQMGDVIPGDWDTVWIGHGVDSEMFNDLNILSSEDRHELARQADGLTGNYNIVMTTQGGHIIWSEFCHADDNYGDNSCVYAKDTGWHEWLRILRSNSVVIINQVEQDLIIVPKSK